jgi:dimethylaniline monooxygenase (N-oxide forming)
LIPTIYEARDGIGGQWRYEEPHPETGEAFSSVYNGVVSNTSSLRSHFSDFPMDPAKYPDYPTHTDYLTYILDYASHFRLESHILLNTEVLSCLKHDDTKWKVITSESEDVYDALFICTGKESIPHTPEIEGFERFEGRIIHSHVYRQPDEYADKRVAVVGFGPSAVDIATEVSHRAKECHLITQRGGWVLPRYVNGKHIESLQSRFWEYLLPRSVLSFSYEGVHRAVMGETPETLKPNHGILEANAVVSTGLLEHVRSGRITAHRASVEKFSETEIILSNQTALEVDKVILCTGYNVTMPVISEDTYRGDEPNSVRLYRLINPPAHNNLFFMGLVEFLGPIHPTVELQARWAVGVLTARISLPSVEKMEKSIDKFHKDQGHLVSILQSKVCRATLSNREYVVHSISTAYNRGAYTWLHGDVGHRPRCYAQPQKAFQKICVFKSPVERCFNCQLLLQRTDHVCSVPSFRTR